MAGFANSIALILILSIVAKFKKAIHIFKHYCTVRREILFLQNMYVTLNFYCVIRTPIWRYDTCIRYLT